MSDSITINRPLAGSTKQYLDDLLALDKGVTDEMQRGIREGYLDVEGAIALAEKLGVEKPRVKRTFRMYFERTSVYTVTVEAYDEDEAEQEAARLLDQNVRRGDTYYGSQTRFRNVEPGSGGPRHRFSVVSRQRPEVDQPVAPHPRTINEAERIRQARNDADSSRMAAEGVF